MNENDKKAVVEAAPKPPLEIIDEHLKGVIQGDHQRKAFVAAIKDAIDAAIAQYHEDRHA